MKKSTILLLAIVYIVSFLLVWLLGQAVRAYDPVVYPTSIELVEPDGRAKLIENPSEETKKQFEYYYVVNPYHEGMSISMKATVKPDNTNFPNVSFIYDESNTSFNLRTKEDDPSIENNYAVITLNVIPTSPLVVRFTVSTQTPGTNIKARVGIVFVNA